MPRTIYACTYCGLMFEEQAACETHENTHIDRDTTYIKDASGYRTNHGWPTTIIVADSITEAIAQYNLASLL